MKALLPLLIAFLSLCGRSRSQDLRVTGGIVDHQVLQRNSENTADLRLTGSVAGADGRLVEARILSKGLEIQAFPWSSVARIKRGTWSCEVRKIPVGGPYRLELRVFGYPRSFVAEDILVGDLWVLAGQSNMQGRGNLDSIEQPHPLVHSFDLTDQWLLAQEPLHRFIDAIDPVHRNGKPRAEGMELQETVAKAQKGTGLGLPFAVEMVRRTGVPVGLIPCAHGGTSMDEWDPQLKDKGGDSLYGSMLRRVSAVGGQVAGMLWYQGEADAWPAQASGFRQKFEKFAAAVESHLGHPQFGFYYVQLGRYTNLDPGRSAWNEVQESQRMAERDMAPVGMVAAVDAELEDYIHLSTAGLKRVGHRLANLACHDVFPDVESCRGLKRGPRPASITSKRDPVLEEVLIRVTFSDVNGGLRADGRVTGFSVHFPQGQVIPVIYKAKIDPKDPSTVMLYLKVASLENNQLPAGATLRYGYGNDPYCNLMDDADMAVPVFGPIPIP